METLTSAPIDNYELIISLIKDDLVNSRLIHNLNSIGIDANNYNLNLRMAILKLMGFQSVSDSIHDQYYEFTLRSKDIDFVADPQLLNPLVQEIYRFLNGLDRKTMQTRMPLVINKTIITDLIRQDLINYSMIHSLGNIQINAEDYLLDIGRIVFEIMDIESREDVETIFEQYSKMSEQVLSMQVSQSSADIKRLAGEIYGYLEGK